MKKIKKLIVILGTTTVFSLNMGGLFITTDNIAQADSQKITDVKIKNIPNEDVTTKVPFNF